VNELLGSKKSELILFYGEPGTGKTSLIKHLIKDNKDKPFIFIDGSLFSSISDGTFLSFITDNKNAVLIFEDCEKILMKRDESYNQNIGTLLNLTDGLMADEYTLKFIMTFNCPMDKIDDALRRKGRLSLEYKFDKLKADKAHKINNSANEDITLADLYNLEEEVSIGAKKRVKIGFNK
jgi:SpoVK/Ycf46/Vps4 family AAA+-type ATPase